MDALLQPLQPFFAAAFTLWGSPVSWIEVVAFVLSIAMVLYNMRVDPLGWPLAIVSSLLYFALLWTSGLYGEAWLQIFFAVVAGWGWWQWLRGTQADGSALRPRPLGPRGRWVALAAFAVAWPLIGGLLHQHTDSQVPWWDAFPTAGSVVAQALLGRQYIENWPAWVVVNVVSVTLFAYKGLWLTALLYAIFVALSFAGWRAWRRLAAAT
ncbi:MAG: nicotinamide riboside transporter PnuC [Burkholderiaceae bacterium]